MARTTLEMFIKIVGANKVAQALDNVSNELKDQQKQVEKNEESNKKLAKSMSGLSKAAIAGASLFAAKSILSFSKSALDAAVSAEEAGAAFETTFGTAAQRATKFLEGFANKAGLTVGEAQQLQATLGAVAQGIGFTQEASADLSIELTKIAADVASFSNISAGAEPVLQAFRSALVGEREALKTYGIAITEAEVQTKALELTTKTSVDELTRQDKALATLALIQKKAAVQIGDLDRTSESYANQSRALNAEIRQLREEIGEELIPAAAALIPILREFAFEIAPALISGFGGFAKTIVDFSLAADRLDLNFFQTLLQFGNIRKLADEQRILTRTTKLLAEGFDFSNNAEKRAELETRKLRQQMTLIIPTNKKFGASINKDVLPFAEKLAKILGITNNQIEIQKDLQKDRDEAQSDLNRALEEEGLITAQEALRKKELQQQIAELTFFQGQGKNVTEELAVAQEELRLIELALTRESDQLIEARKRAAEAQEDLDDATNNGTDSMNAQLEAAQNLQQVIDLFNTDNFQDQIQEAADVLDITWKEALDGALAEYYYWRQQVTGQTLTQEVDQFLKDLDEQGLLVGGFKPSPLAGGGDTPPDTLGDQNNIIPDGNNGGGDKDLTIVLEIDGEAIQKVNTRLQEQGKTFLVR